MDREAKRLRNVSPGDLAGAIGALEARVEVLKAEAIRRDLHRVEGENYRIVLTRPAPSSDAPKRLHRPSRRARWCAAAWPDNWDAGSWRWKSTRADEASGFVRDYVDRNEIVTMCEAVHTERGGHTLA